MKKKSFCERKIRAQKKEVFPDKKEKKNTVRRKEQKEFERGERGNNVPFEREKGSEERGGRVRGVRGRAEDLLESNSKEC